MVAVEKPVSRGQVALWRTPGATRTHAAALAVGDARVTTRTTPEARPVEPRTPTQHPPMVGIGTVRIIPGRLAVIA